MEKIAIIGMGLTQFGKFEDKTAAELAVQAINDALKDAGVAWKDVQVAAGGSLDGGYADTLVSKLGPTGVTFTNVYNACATGGSALNAVITAIEAGRADVGLVVGFDKHPRGMFKFNPADQGLRQYYEDMGFMVTVQFFSQKTTRYMHDYDISEDVLVEVAHKAWGNAAMNPRAWRKNAFSRDDIRASRMLAYPFRQYMLCNPSDGAAALVVCKGSIAKKFTTKPIYVKANALSSRLFGSFEVMSPSKRIEKVPTVVELAAEKAFKMAGIGPQEIQIAQVQDSESGHEIMHMAETGLCKHGEQTKLIMDGETRIGGKLPINTDGGLMANGEPIGASAIRQIFEICLQMRGEAGERQVPNNPLTGLTQVYGMPGVSSVVILEK